MGEERSTDRWSVFKFAAEFVAINCKEKGGERARYQRIRRPQYRQEQAATSELQAQPLPLSQRGDEGETSREISPNISDGCIEQNPFHWRENFHHQTASQQPESSLNVQEVKKGQKKTPAGKIISQNHFPASVIICATWKMLLVFIDQNFKINATNYQQ